MKRKDHIEMQRVKVAMLIRAQASIVRAEFINEVLPTALEAFDARVLNGEAIEVLPVDVTALIEKACSDVTG